MLGDNKRKKSVISAVLIICLLMAGVTGCGSSSSDGAVADLKSKVATESKDSGEKDTSDKARTTDKESTSDKESASDKARTTDKANTSNKEMASDEKSTSEDTSSDKGDNTTDSDLATSVEELIEPEGAVNIYDYASYRNIYDTDVYSCMVVPSVKEYLYTADEAFGYYGVLPGDTVSKNDVIIYADTGDLYDKIEDKEDEVDSKARDYIESLTELYEDLYDAQDQEYKAAQSYSGFLSWMPEEDSPGYTNWAKMALPSEGAVKSAEQNRKKIEQRIKEAEELYELDKTYDHGVIDRLRAKINNTSIHSNDSGTVVAMNNYSEGDHISKNSEIMAIANTEDKIFMTEYISAGVINKAEDVYAIVDGERFEVTYVPIENDEYARLKKKNKSVYSSFYIEDPDNKLEMGDFGDIVIVNKSARNVLTVQNDAIYKEDSESYVYLLNEDDSTTSVRVETGIKDGIYTEILTGLRDGDKVLTQNAILEGKRTEALTKGSISSEFQEAGYLYYPSSKWVTNPAKRGTCYINKLCVDKYEHVEKGQVIAKVEVIADTVSIKRQERKLLRAQQRLVRLYEKKTETTDEATIKSLDRAIRQREASIEDLNKEIAKLKEYSGIVNLVAEYDGIVTDITELKEGELINYKERLVQLSDSSECYIAVEDSEKRLSLGNEATISYKDEEGNKVEVIGTVATVNEAALSASLQTGYALIKLPKEDSVKMAAVGSSRGDEGKWNRSRFSVTATIRDVENVVLVPKRAVTEKGGYTYVRVNTDNGVGTYVAFVAGGSDLSNYWVVEGLSEGTKICLE